MTWDWQGQLELHGACLAGQAVFASIAAQQEEARKAQQAEEEVRKAKEEEARKAQQAEEEARKSKEEQEKAAKDAGLEKRLGDMLKEIKKKRGEKRSKEEMEGEKDERARAMDEKGKEEEKKRGPIPAFQPQHRKDSMQKPTKQNREKGRWAEMRETQDDLRDIAKSFMAQIEDCSGGCCACSRRGPA